MELSRLALLFVTLAAALAGVTLVSDAAPGGAPAGEWSSQEAMECDPDGQCREDSGEDPLPHNPQDPVGGDS